MDTKERIDTLVKELNRHSYLYYVEENPSLSDFEYDEMSIDVADSGICVLFIGESV